MPSVEDPTRPAWPVPWPADLDPADLRQPDRVSCGAAAVVAARVLLRPGWRPADPTAEIRLEHRHLTSTHSPRDRFQVPWPRQLGTPPWAIATALGVLSGQRLATVHARPRPVEGYQVLVEHLRTRPVALYLGNGWMPRHVVLAVEAVADDLGVRVFDPASGRLLTVAAQRWRQHRVGVAGWNHLWFVL
ncbi:hypothetical protein FXB39_06060 [Nocardioides sp. BGMRC 2183]|nr:hypothetical protein FXB39_06060 [Nocardioides sp. BGMRC 2183]